MAKEAKRMIANNKKAYLSKINMRLAFHLRGQRLSRCAWGGAA